MTATIESAESRTGFRFFLCTGLVFIFSVAATTYFVRSMAGTMNMPGGWKMSMMWMRMPGDNWLNAPLMFLSMWATMMIAMMLPSALPMLMRSPQTAAFVGAGYFLIWTAVGGMIYFIGINIASAAMRSSTLSSNVLLINGICLILAGAFQFTRWKRVALNHCRDPFICGSRATNGPKNGFIHGLRQGMFCSICCSGLMLMLLILGIMNLFAMVAIAVVIALEKMLPNPSLLVRVTGLFAVLGGIISIVAFAIR